MALRIKGALLGADKVRKALEREAKRAPGAVARALYQTGVVVSAEAVRRAPVEFGVLRSSGYVAPPTQEGNAVGVEVGFGTVYAARQHEETTWQHPRGGEAKYLEKAVRAKATLERVAAFARANVEQGLTSPVLPGAPPKRPQVRRSVQRRQQERARERREKRREQLRKRRGRAPRS